VTRPCVQLPQNSESAPSNQRTDQPPVDSEPGTRPTGFAENPTWFALRTSAAALVALAVAHAFDVHHPWWAAMTVWLVAQPTRGLLLERSLARLAGTACGALAGALILYSLEDRLLLSAAALMSWLALCAGLGSMFRHFRNYGFVLAGYTAAVVVLFSWGDGTYDPGVGLDRVLCTIIGIICSALASWPGVSAGRGKEPQQRLEEIIQRCLDRVEEYLSEARAQASSISLIADIAALDRALDEDTAGSLSACQDAMRVRQVCGLLLELIALTSARGTASGDVPIKTSESAQQRIIGLAALARATGQISLANTLDEVLQVLRRSTAVMFGGLQTEFDTSSVLRAAFRPIIAVAIALAAWWSTSWQTGNIMVMTAALFATLFSSHDQGNQALIQVLIGSVLGAFAGIIARLLLLPYADGLLPTLLCIAPVLLLGAWLMRRPATAKMAIDLNMTFLLTAQPTSPLEAPEMVLNQVVAILAGVLAVVVTYWLVLPATPQVRIRLLAQRIARLTIRISESRNMLAAATAQRSLAATQVRLSGFVEPASGLFTAAQNCLAEGRRALAGWSQPLGAEHASRSISTTTQNTLRRASALLSACVELVQRSKPPTASIEKRSQVNISLVDGGPGAPESRCGTATHTTTHCSPKSLKPRARILMMRTVLQLMFSATGRAHCPESVPRCSTAPSRLSTGATPRSSTG
jgi:uncharacterized membrane protein YccC